MKKGVNSAWTVKYRYKLLMDTRPLVHLTFTQFVSIHNYFKEHQLNWRRDGIYLRKNYLNITPRVTLILLIFHAEITLIFKYFERF